MSRVGERQREARAEELEDPFCECACACVCLRARGVCVSRCCSKKKFPLNMTSPKRWLVLPDNRDEMIQV